MSSGPLGIHFPPETGEITCETASDIRDLEGVQEGVEEAVEVEGRGNVDQKLALCVVVYVGQVVSGDQVDVDTCKTRTGVSEREREREREKERERERERYL